MAHGCCETFGDELHPILCVYFIVCGSVVCPVACPLHSRMLLSRVSRVTRMSECACSSVGATGRFRVVAGVCMRSHISRIRLDLYAEARQNATM
eukprot:4892280-Prymnesium_polylepis.2